VSIRDGRRRGTRERIQEVEQRHPERLQVALNALATTVLFDDGGDTPRALGVRYLRGARLYAAAPPDPEAPDTGVPETQDARCRREVILCAGAFNTPQLLMLSGIGPRAELDRHGIPVRLDRPGVGANLQDRYEVGVVVRMKQSFTLLDGAQYGTPGPGEQPDPLYRAWLEGGGPYATNGAVLSVMRRSDRWRREPDLFCFALIGGFRGYYPGYARDAVEWPCLTWAILKAHTENRGGRVTLRSDDPRARPHVNFHYFDEGSGDWTRDLSAVVEGIRFCRRLNAEYADLIEQELVPGPEVETQEQLEQFVRDRAWGHHASCSCRIGRSDDPDAVVDNAFRVIGTEGLRIVDASVFPRVPGFFIVTPIYMIAEKASDMILADAPDPGAAA
jgi:choline dehydrogenase